VSAPCFVPGFAPEQNEADYLRRRLGEEKAKVANADRMRQEAEERCLVVERERVSAANSTSALASGKYVVF
jgi:hypothetical protein